MTPFEDKLPIKSLEKIQKLDNRAKKLIRNKKRKKIHYIPLEEWMKNIISEYEQNLRCFVIYNERMTPRPPARPWVREGVDKIVEAVYR